MTMSPTRSLCVDTAESSAETVRSMNDFSSKYFQAAVEEGDLATAGLWQANVGRSLSFGDFVMVNVARTDLDKGRARCCLLHCDGPRVSGAAGTGGAACASALTPSVCLLWPR